MVAENLKNAITSGSIYRAIGIVASIHILGLVIGNKIFQKALTMSVVDYYQNTFVKENQQFQIAGVIKPGTFTVKRGTLETKFTITDFENDIEVFYRGATKFEFKEGETIILSAFLPDINNKKKVVR
jgi:cytochrome c-type biogenesis protein CcmE